MYIEYGIKPKQDNQILNEIDYFKWRTGEKGI